MTVTRKVCMYTQGHKKEGRAGALPTTHKSGDGPLDDSDRRLAEVIAAGQHLATRSPFFLVTPRLRALRFRFSPPANPLGRFSAPNPQENQP